MGMPARLALLEVHTAEVGIARDSAGLSEFIVSTAAAAAFAVDSYDRPTILLPPGLSTR